MKLKDRLNSENRAIWNTLQYRYRNYIETEMMCRGDMSIDELKESLNENSELDGKYAIYEQGAKDATKHTIERLLKIIGDEN